MSAQNRPLRASLPLDEVMRQMRDIMVEMAVARAARRLAWKEKNFTHVSRVERMIASLEFRAELLLEQAREIEANTTGNER